MPRRNRKTQKRRVRSKPDYRVRSKPDCCTVNVGEAILNAHAIARRNFRPSLRGAEKGIVSDTNRR